MTACARSLAEPEDEVLDLDSLAEATDEAEKAKAVNSDSRVETLRTHLLEAVKAITTSYRGDAEIALALADFLKACTSTNIATPLSVDPLALTDILSHLITLDLDATWLSISSLLLFRLRKNPLSENGQITLQAALARVLDKGLSELSTLPSSSSSHLGPAQMGCKELTLCYVGMEAHPDLVQGFMDWSLSTLTSYAPVLASMPQMLEGLVVVSISGLELQERVGLQKTIQVLVSAYVIP